MTAAKISIGIAATCGYIASIPAANWMVTHYGIIPVGLGLTAPAGVYLIGPALVARDLVQWTLGRAVSLIALAIGVLLSYALSTPTLAWASAAGFGVSELLDFAVFTWLAPRWTRAVFLGGVVGLTADSAIFLTIAFGSLALMPGQMLGKAYGVLIATTVIASRRRRIGTVSPA